MVGARWIRRRLAWLPERIKRPVQRRLIGFRPSAIDLPVAFDRDSGGGVVRVDNRASLRFRDEERAELEDMLQTNGSCVEEMAGFLRLATKARVLFDVGAAKGVFSLIFCLGDPAARAVAFEPSPPMAEAAAALIVLNACDDRVRLEKAAVGREPGRHAARLDPWGYVTVDADAAGAQRVELVVTSVDREVDRLGVEPDLIKIDVEGYELEVLLGARDLLARRRPPLCLELHLDLLEKKGTSPGEVLDELDRHGYTLQSCTGRPLRRSAILRTPNAVMRLVAV